MTKTLEKEIEETVSQEVRDGGFRGNYKVFQIPKTPHIDASINLEDSHIRIGYNPAYEERKPGKIRVMARDATRHEINHQGYRGYNGCPRNVELHSEKVAEPIAEVLMPKGYNKDDMHYVANTLEDTILHADLKRGFSLEGIAEFFSDVGESTSDRRFTDFYDAHVRLNMMLWGTTKQKKKSRDYLVRDSEKREKITEVLKEFLRKSGIEEFKHDLDGRSARDRQAIRDFLNDEENWPRIAKAYAEEFSKLMTPGYAMPTLSHSGRGTKGRESEKPSEIDGNIFDREMETREFKERRVMGSYREGKKLPATIETFEGLDLLYQSLAKRLNIKVESYTESEQRPVVWYGRKEFDPDRDDDKHLTFGFDEQGEIALQKKRWSEKMKIPHKRNPKGFPKAKFALLDTSGSMTWSPEGSSDTGNTNIVPWGDNSRYHYGLLGWYGFLEYLKQNHLLSQQDIELANFSEKTTVGKGLSEAKRVALDPKFGKDTQIEAKVVDDFFSGEGNLVFTISDGDISNWDDIKNSFIKGARRHHYFHLQIGEDADATEEIRKAGLAVVPVRDARDLAEKVIDLTDTLYRGGNK